MFRRLLRCAHPSFDAERLLRVMVFNRLCDPESKLASCAIWKGRSQRDFILLQPSNITK